jgi:ABC-type Fe3+ transport system substrate-binding protein
MITGKESLQQVVEISEALVPIFDKYGMGSYFKPENLSKIGRFMKLDTLLKSKQIDRVNFLELLNNVISDASLNSGSSNESKKENLHLSAMLPCGLRNPFKEFFETEIQKEASEFAYLNYLIEGNVNHELSYYPLLDSIEDISELPDIILASDINNFFHKPFMEKFILKGAFNTYKTQPSNSYLEKVRYNDTEGNFTMFTSNLLVMAVDKAKLGDRDIPHKWDDLLDCSFADDIIMRGEDNFFCNAVMLPFYKDHGFEAIKKLACNIYSGLHPAEMVKLAGSGKPEGRAIYILPYFFAKRIKNPKVEIVWPCDGAIASPVFMLVKKGCKEKHAALLNMLTSKEMGEMLTGRFFPTTHPGVFNTEFKANVKWLGWDFIYSNDIGKLKEDIRASFMEVWDSKNAVV